MNKVWERMNWHWGKRGLVDKGKREDRKSNKRCLGLA